MLGENRSPSPAAPSDAELALRWQDGDERALKILLTRYRPLLRSAAGRYRLRGGDYEDLLQEARIGLMQAAEGFAPDRRPSFAAYATVTIHNRLRDAVRRDAARSQRLLSDASSLDLDPATENEYDPVAAVPDAVFAEKSRLLGAQPEQALESERSLEAVMAAVFERLSELERLVLLERLAGRTIGEIAARHGFSHNRVSAALARSRRKLRQALG
ncbi:MAG: sigma-70 family RNA polymerase sigma factor [Bacillota bacterium]|nr:sigma-70 family RNA polymerase sigma factor [Bacillota bacterium]